MRNVTALLVGVATYVVFGTIFGLMSLGVGFMSEPDRTMYTYIILLVPFVPAGFAIGYLARSCRLAQAAALAAIAFAIFLAMAPGPMPLFLREHTDGWALVVQGGYQAALYLLVCALSTWLGAKFRAARSPLA